MRLPSLLLEQLGQSQTQRCLRYVMKLPTPYEMLAMKIASADNIARDEVDNKVDSLNLGL